MMGRVRPSSEDARFSQSALLNISNLQLTQKDKNAQ
jgi:hypothetical protein